MADDIRCVRCGRGGIVPVQHYINVTTGTQRGMYPVCVACYNSIRAMIPGQEDPLLAENARLRELLAAVIDEARQLVEDVQAGLHRGQITGQSTALMKRINEARRALEERDDG